MKRLLFLIRREFRLFAGNKIMLAFYLGGPILYGGIFGLVYAKGKINDLPIVVVDKDHSPLSAQLIDMLDDADVLEVRTVRNEALDLQKVFMADTTYAVVEIPYQFEADVLQGRHPELITYINNTNLLASGYVSRSISGVAATLNAMRPAASGRTTEAFRLNVFKLFNPSSNYFLYAWPSYLGIILQAVVMVVLALSFASEQESGALPDLYRQSGGSALTILLSKAGFYWMLSLFILLVYGLYFYLFHQPFPEHYGSLALTAFLFIAATSFLGMSAGLLFRTQLASLQFLIILSTPAYISSGYSWPYDEDGWAAQLFGHVFPYMPFVNSARILVNEHGTAGDIRDYTYLQAEQLLFYFILAWVLLKIKTGRRRGLFSI
jgi:ABC-2 type transport system permease protein